MIDIKNAVLFIDGAAHASVWTTGPLLLAALSFPSNKDVSTSIRQRPRSVEDALNVTGRTQTNLNQSTLSVPSDVRNKIFHRTLPALMAAILLVFLMGRVIGNGCYKSSLLRRKLQSIPSSKVSRYFISTIVPLIIVNWGWGIYRRESLMFVRFVTAIISGVMMQWAKNQQFFQIDSKDIKEHHEGTNNDLDILEEGRNLMHPFSSDGDNDDHSDIDDREQWINWYWIAGAGCSSLLGSHLFYPTNCLMMSLEPRLLVLISLIVIGMALNRLLSRQYSSDIATSSHVSKDTRSISAGDDSIGSIYMGAPLKQSKSSSTIQRRKQVSNSQQRDSYNKMASSRPRLYSDTSTDSDEFFDCLDDIELGLVGESSHQLSNNSTSKNYDRQIAKYSGRKVIYSDGSDAFVPANESISSIPAGYLSMNRNDQDKSQSSYEATQRWRRSEQINCIHSKHHAWYQKIKAAYPHVIHGFTPDGMPVLYEAPGKMNLKQLLRNGCQVSDMIFHYCYMMEYLSNIESVLSEVNDSSDDLEWQECLAAYAHAKQMRLQNDSIPFGFVVVMDISGASPSSLSSDVLAYLKQAGDVNSLHYPGSMRRAILVQAPFWVGSMWKALKGILPASVAVDLLSSKSTTNGGLKQYISEDQIPVEYGGKSPFKLGEHPFEVGFKRLAESEGNEVDASSRGSSDLLSAPLQDDDASLRPNIQNSRQHHDNIVASRRAESIKPSSEHKALSQGWEGLGASYILVVASLLQLSSYAVVGSIEISIPLWIISADGMGYEAQRTGQACFGTSFVILQVFKRIQVHLSSRSIRKNPSRSFRIGIVTSFLSLVCVNLIPLTSNLRKSLIGLGCLSVLGAFVYLGLVMGVMSVDHLRAVAISSSNDHINLPSGLAFMKSSKSTQVLNLIGRVVGYICFLAIYIGSGTWFLSAYSAIAACILTSFLI